jgi:hypothetical protein
MGWEGRWFIANLVGKRRTATFLVYTRKMTNSRIIELAIKGLEAERARIDQELAALKNQLNTKPSITRNQPRVAGRGVRSTPPRRRGRITPAGRKRLSELARTRWIMRRKLGKTTL